MTMQEAVRARHTVRRYTDQAIPGELAELLRTRIAENNQTHSLCLTLVTGNADGAGRMAKLISRSVNNYIALAGPDRPGLDEALGWCGADLILYAQTLGLNTWWIGGMASSKGALRHLDARDARVNGIIAVGFGQTQGVPHKSKAAAEISTYEGEAPRWFTDGVEALLCAPSALNKQPYTVRGAGNRVSLSAGDGHFSGVDLGIGKYHFALGAGQENFVWV